MLILNFISISKFHFIYWLSCSLALLLLVPCGNMSEALHPSSAVVCSSILGVCEAGLTCKSSNCSINVYLYTSHAH